MRPLEQKLVDFIGAQIMQAAQDHARAVFPQESCGFVADGQYFVCENKAKDPKKDFEISDERYDQAFTAGKLKAVIHSHPYGPIFPTKIDMTQQLATGVPWVIITLNDDQVSHLVGWGGDLPRAPLIQRPFVHGVLDCYSLLRDTFALGRDELLKQGIGWPLPPIELEEFPRDDEWWKDDDLYTKNFESQGFRTISRSEAKPGDVFLIAIGDRARNPHKRLNHAGMLIEHELALHHLPNRLSARDPAGRWARAADLWIRHKEADK